MIRIHSDASVLTLYMYAEMKFCNVVPGEHMVPGPFRYLNDHWLLVSGDKGSECQGPLHFPVGTEA
jgi:hypothetical protein